MKLLNEKLYKVNEDYDTIEMEVSDSDIHRYLDLKYDSEEIINLAQQFNHEIGSSDLDAAYAEIIKHFDEIDDNNEFEDLIDLNKYLQTQIDKDYNVQKDFEDKLNNIEN